MIKTWKHKGLRELQETGRSRLIEKKYSDRVAEILKHLDAAATTLDVNLPGYRLHTLAPYRPSTWSIRAYGPWRITFVFEKGDAYDVDLEQYHDR